MFTFSVMGDSISSFEGTSPENYAVAYPMPDSGVYRRDDMWWAHFERLTGNTMICNDSYSGSRVSETGSRPLWSAFVSDSRIARLKGDAVIVFGGTNDFGQRADGAAPLAVFEAAYTLLIKKIRKAMPHAAAYFCVPLVRSDWELTEKNDCGWTQLDLQHSVRSVVAAAHAADPNIRAIDLSEIAVDGLLADRLHPNKKGMEALASYIAAHL